MLLSTFCLSSGPRIVPAHLFSFPLKNTANVPDILSTKRGCLGWDTAGQSLVARVTCLSCLCPSLRALLGTFPGVERIELLADGLSKASRWHHATGRCPFVGEKRVGRGSRYGRAPFGVGFGLGEHRGGSAGATAPRPLMKALGLGNRPNLVRILSVGELMLDAGLLLGRNKSGWYRSRGM